MLEPVTFSDAQVTHNMALLADWLRANGVDPAEVAVSQIAVIDCPCCNTSMIRDTEYLTGEDGKRYYDKEADAPAAVERLTPCTVPPPALTWVGDGWHQPEDDDGPQVQCWHIEPGTPCDWHTCRQPERLAAGDAGTDPARR